MTRIATYLKTRAVLVGLLALCALASVVAIAYAVAPPIPSDATPPSGHYSAACSGCHSITPVAPPIAPPSGETRPVVGPVRDSDDRSGTLDADDSDDALETDDDCDDATEIEGAHEADEIDNVDDSDDVRGPEADDDDHETVGITVRSRNSSSAGDGGKKTEGSHASDPSGDSGSGSDD